VLSADGQFQLPGKEALQEDENNDDEEIETVAVDVTEHPIQRPKKNRKTGIPARKSGIRSNRRSL
jgi:hypothetical protein